MPISYAFVFFSTRPPVHFGDYELTGTKRYKKASLSPIASGEKVRRSLLARGAGGGERAIFLAKIPRESTGTVLPFTASLCCLCKFAIVICAKNSLLYCTEGTNYKEYGARFKIPCQSTMQRTRRNTCLCTVVPLRLRAKNPPHAPLYAQHVLQY